MTALNNSTAIPAKIVPDTPAFHSFARLPAAIDQSGLSRSTIYDLVQRGLFPPPIKAGPKLALWVRSEISAWCAAQIAGKSEGEIKALIVSFVEARKDAA